MLSALNILNESEINYRLAKNKRLHVELTFIKLSYLSQALDLVNENGQLSKKKQVESIRPVSFKTISPISFPNQKKEGSKVVSPKTKKENASPESLKNSGAKLVIDKEANSN